MTCMRSKLCLVAISVLWMQIPVQGQTATGWTQFTNCSTVEAMVFSKGAFWIATDAGLFRYDTATRGLACFTNANSLVPGLVQSLAVAPDGEVYAGATGGIARFDGNAWNTVNDWTVKGEVVSIAFDRSGALYASTEFGGVYKYDGEKWRDLLDEHPGFPMALVKGPAFVYPADSLLWIAGSSRFFWDQTKPLVFFNGHAWQSVIDEVAWNCALDGNNKMWCLHNPQEFGPAVLDRFSGAAAELMTAPSTSLYSQYSMLFSPGSRLWIWNRSYSSSSSGIWAGDGKTWEKIAPPEGAAGMTALAFDPSGKALGVFVSSGKPSPLSALSFSPEIGWKKEFDLPRPLFPQSTYDPGNQIIQLVEGGHDSIWIAPRGGLQSALWDGHGWSPFTLPGPINSIGASGAGEVWFALSDGLLCRRRESGGLDTVHIMPFLSSSIKTCLSKGTDGILYAMVLAPDPNSIRNDLFPHLFAFNGAIWSLLSKGPLIKSYFSICSFAMADKGWLIVDDSTYVFSGNEGWRNRTDYLRKRWGGKIMKAVAARNGAVWLGTSAGRLIKIKGADTVDIPAPATGGSQNYEVTPMAVDSTGAVWCRLYYFDSLRYLGVYAGIGRYAGGGWSVLDCKNSGIPSTRVNDILFDSRGRMWVATDFGIGMLDPRSVSVSYNNSGPTGAASDVSKKIKIIRSMQSKSLMVYTGDFAAKKITVYDISGRIIAKGFGSGIRNQRISIRLAYPGIRMLVIRATGNNPDEINATLTILNYPQ